MHPDSEMHLAINKWWFWSCTRGSDFMQHISCAVSSPLYQTNYCCQSEACWAYKAFALRITTSLDLSSPCCSSQLGWLPTPPWDLKWRSCRGGPIRWQMRYAANNHQSSTLICNDLCGSSAVVCFSALIWRGCSLPGLQWWHQTFSIRVTTGLSYFHGT